jgi:hypothetical protein
MGHALQANDDTNTKPETEQELKEWQRVEDLVKTDGTASLETLEDGADALHVVGDIIRVRVYIFPCATKQLNPCTAYTIKSRRHTTTTIYKLRWCSPELK